MDEAFGGGGGSSLSISVSAECAITFGPYLSMPLTRLCDTRSIVPQINSTACLLILHSLRHLGPAQVPGATRSQGSKLLSRLHQTNDDVDRGCFTSKYATDLDREQLSSRTLSVCHPQGGLDLEQRSGASNGSTRGRGMNGGGTSPFSAADMCERPIASFQVSCIISCQKQLQPRIKKLCFTARALAQFA
jgi:hypothetical protein